MMMRNSIFIGFWLILFSVNAQDWANFKKYSADNAVVKASVHKGDRVVFIGNSITEKWSVYDELFFQDNNYINRGISGQVSSQMLLRFRSDVIELTPRVVIISAGTNDIAENKGKISLEHIADNIFSMAEMAKANNIQVILTSVLPASSYSWRPEIYPADKIIELNHLIKQYADNNKLPYVDYYTHMVNDDKGLKNKYGRDSVHPSSEGYKIMEPLIQKAIQLSLVER